MMLASRQAYAWDATFEKLFEGRGIFNAGDVLENLSLNFTAPVTANHRDIDLAAVTFPFVFEALSKLAESSGQRLYIYNGASAEWVDVTRSRFKAYIQREARSGCIEVAFVDQDQRLISRYSITLWKQAGNYIEARNPAAPIKRIRANEKSLARRQKPPQANEHQVDAVFTWVDSSDPDWRASFELHSHTKVADKDRFDQSDELRYSIRAVEQFAPWIKNIFVFSNCAPPSWYSASGKVSWVRHEEVIPSEYLPTFNSHSIETFLHHIPNLSENFIYFNDDFFISDFVSPQDFHTHYGQSVSRLEPYGAIQYLEEICAADQGEEWQYAALNGAKLIYERFGFRPRQIHRHAPYAFQKSVFQQLEQEFPDAFHSTRSARFRTRGDYSVASFLYHHYALAVRSALEANDESMIVRHTNYARFEKQKLYKNMKFFCVNDGGGSGEHAGYMQFKLRFLSKRYPFKSHAER
ncbi:hypothetical protein F4695_004490 [Rhizobium soli]|uniref:Stealth protein SacB n=1 Tax=Rhizobium soli TaxID=424798 RepID=A0A7X0JQJ4_9HYPH|nr:stealth conserved region 3 domain-containing protein [Rhizobium soli]MBB6511092.1 hypothetical protein [Rhizobium soli]